MLAATLNPGAARGDTGDVENALQQAACLYAQSQLFFDENRGLPATEFLVKIADRALLERLGTLLSKAAKEQDERESLRLYEKLSDQTLDTACQFCGWKTPRRVKDNVQAWHLARAEFLGEPASIGEADFKRFWTEATRKDGQGRTYIALHPKLMANVRQWHTDRNRRRTANGVATKRARKEAKENLPPTTPPESTPESRQPKKTGRKRSATTRSKPKRSA